MCELEGFTGCTIKRDHTNITLKIYQPYLINKMTQVFNEYVKSLITCNTPATQHKGVLRNP